MDAGQLYDVFNASFHSDPNVRMQAELQLKKLESQEGFFAVIVQLISSAKGDNAQVVRLAAAIYLKNRVFSSWQAPVFTGAPTNKISPYTPIAESDRQALKGSILPLVAELSGSTDAHAIKLQMAATLSKLIDYDYPGKWQSIIGEVENLLSGNEGQVEAGLRAAVDIMRSFRYTKSDSDPAILDNTARHFFPRLLQIAQQVSSSDPSDGYQVAQQGTLLRLVLKAYKHCIASTLTPALSESSSLVPWGTFFLSLVSKPLPVAHMPEGEEDRQKHPWSKAKKWAHWCLNQLFERYGNPPQLQKGFQEKYGAFADVFIQQFAPEILKAYLNEVERSVQGEWIPRKAKHYVLRFFEECIRSKATWDLLKPHVDSLLEHFLFPLVCLTEEEAAAVDDDPEDFARTHIAELIDDSFNNPTVSSLAFVATLVEVRKKSQLVPLLNFIQTVVSKYPQTTTVLQKDGALRLLGAIAEVATKSKKIAPMMETFFTTHILPEFKSPHALLRYRVCDIVEKFEANDMEWNNKDNLRRMFAAMLEAITDPALPVRLAAANALPELVRYTEVRDQMVPNIGRVMQELLKLTEEIDLDSLTTTMRSIVSEFAEEVVPFALELIQKLSESLRRLVPELLEARNRTEESSLDDEKALVCMNLFKTIDQTIAGLQDQPDTLAAVTPIVLPIIEMVVTHGLTELFDEAYELLDSLTFFYKQMTPEMWPIFDATYRTLKGDNATYFPDVYGFIDNAIAYGASALSTDHERKNMLVDLFTFVMDSRMLGAEDRVIGCKLGEAMLLHLRGYVDEAIPPIVERAMNFVLTKKEDPDFVVTTGLYFHSLELAFTALFYNPALTLAILDRHDWTQQFFAAWFKHLSTLNRVHDIKLSVCAICAVFEYLTQNPTAPLASAASQLLAGSLDMFKHLPGALTKKAELEKEYAKEGGESGDEGDEEELVDDDFDVAEDEGDVRDKSFDLLDRLAQKYADDADASNSDLASEWSEEVLWASPLDAIDVYGRFATLITGLETSAPALFQSATASLTNEQKHRLEEVVRNAMQGGEQLYRPAPGQVAAPGQQGVAPARNGS